MVPGWPRFPGTGLVPIFRCFRIALAGLLRAVKTGSQCIRHSIHNAFTGKRSAADRADVSCLFCQNCLNYRGLRFLEKRLIILEGKHRNIRKIAVFHSDLHFYLSSKPFSCAHVDAVFVLAFFRTFRFHGGLFGYGFGSRERVQIAHEYRSADYGSGGSACHGAGRGGGQALFGTYGKALHALDAFHGHDRLFLRYGDSHAAGPGTKPAVCAGIALASYFVQPFSGNHSQQCSQGTQIPAEKAPHKQGTHSDCQQQPESHGGYGRGDKGKISRDQHPEHAPGTPGRIHRQRQYPNSCRYQDQYCVLQIFQDAVQPFRNLYLPADSLFGKKENKLLHHSEGTEKPAEKTPPQSGNQKYHGNKEQLRKQSAKRKTASCQCRQYIPHSGKHHDKQSRIQDKSGRLNQMPDTLCDEPALFCSLFL